MDSLPRIGVLVSGTGRSLENLAAEAREGSLPARIALVVCNVPDAPALQRARRLELPTAVIPHRDAPDARSFSAAVFRALEQAGCQLAVLAGFLRKLLLDPTWEGRVLNIHPSLLPAFGGQGFYGRRVHRAVLERGVQFTGCTVHYVTAEYDAGPIVLQRCIPVLPDDTEETLAARVFEEEKIALPQAIAMHLRGEVALREGSVVRAPRRGP